MLTIRESQTCVHSLSEDVRHFRFNSYPRNVRHFRFNSYPELSFIFGLEINFLGLYKTGRRIHLQSFSTRRSRSSSLCLRVSPANPTAGMSIEYEATGNFILSLINSSLDRCQYEVWALISTSQSLVEYAVAPFRFVWRFNGDRTVYCVVRSDLWPDVQPSDFVKWFCEGDMCCFFCKVPWVDIRYCLEARSNQELSAAFITHDPFGISWGQLRTYVRLYLGRDREEQLAAFVL